MAASLDPRPAAARKDVLEALPALMTLLRRLVVTALEAGDPEADELRALLDACVVGAHRIRLREHLRDESVAAEGG